MNYNLNLIMKRTVIRRTLTVFAFAFSSQFIFVYLQPIITQYFIDNKSEIWLLFLIAHSKR